MLVTADVLKKFGPNRREVNNQQAWNMSIMSFTAEVSNDERSREVNEEQRENIEPMLVTAEVSNDERSREVNEEQSMNI